MSREVLPMTSEELLEVALRRLKRDSRLPTDKSEYASWYDSRARDLQFAAACFAHAKGNWDEFRKYLKEAAECKLSIFKLEAKGVAVDPSYLSMSGMWSMFLALASGEMNVAIELAREFGGRDAIEKKNDLPFTRAMGYLVRDAILSDYPLAARIKALESACTRTGYHEFTGYLRAFAGIESVDSKGFQGGLEQIALEYPKLARTNRYFCFRSDKYFCLWGIGVGNLAVTRGLTVEPVPPLVPAESLLQSETSVMKEILRPVRKPKSL